jgi:hypothetical protein
MSTRRYTSPVGASTNLVLGSAPSAPVASRSRTAGTGSASLRSRSPHKQTPATRVPFSGTLRHHHNLVSPYITPEVGGVLHCIAVHIVVEIRKDIQSVGQVLVDLGGMGCEGLACVTATRADSMKTQIGPVGGEAPRMVGDEVMDAEGCRTAPQDGVDFVAEPSRITKFDGPAVGARCSLEEASKTSRIRSPVKRQLDKDRAKRLSEPTRPVEELCDRRVRLFQALQVRAIVAERQRCYDFQCQE